MHKGGFYSATIVSVAVLVMICIASFITLQDHQLQTQFNQRQQYINDSVQLSSVNQSLIKALASASVNNTAIRQILLEAGLTITYRQNDPQPQPAPETITIQP